MYVHNLYPYMTHHCHYTVIITLKYVHEISNVLFIVYSYSFFSFCV